MVVRPTKIGYGARVFKAALTIVGLAVAIPSAHAADITYRYDHFLFNIPASAQADWTREAEAWTYNGRIVTPPQILLADGDEPPSVPHGFARSMVRDYAPDAIRSTLHLYIADRFDREAGSVIIDTTASGAVTFDAQRCLATDSRTQMSELQRTRPPTFTKGLHTSAGQRP